METKTGLKTTEFWISAFLFLLGAAAFLVDSLGASDSLLGKGVAGLLALAATLGYTIPRAGVKKRALEAEAATILAGLHSGEGEGEEEDPS